MEHLFTNMERVAKTLENKTVLLFLDYDGTLTPLQEHPDKAVLSADMREALEAVGKAPECRIIALSGRALNDVRGKVGMKKVIYVGNHGLEIAGPDITFSGMLTPRFKETLKGIKEEIQRQIIPRIPGMWVEDKGATISIHYRVVVPERHASCKRVLQKIIRIYQINKDVRAVWGKKVLELRPPIEWDKGKAALWLLKSFQTSMGTENVLPVYLGDDTTDEDAFRVLKKMGATVLVGRKRRSYAQYYLQDPQEVKEFLKEIAALKTRKSHA